MDKRFLVVDDEECLRFTFERFLLARGYCVETASDYQEALVMVADNDYDVIIADILLGGETGIDLLRQLRAQKVLCPVVMVTGFPNVETASESVRLGAFDYLTKPVLKDDLLKVAAAAVKHRDSVAQDCQRRENLENIFDTVNEGLYSIDCDSNILESNEIARRTCGLTEDCIGSNYMEQTQRCSGRCHASIGTALAEGKEVVVGPIECLHIERPEQVVTLAALPLRGKDDVQVGALVVIKGGQSLAELPDDQNDGGQFRRLVGESKAMREMYRLLEDLVSVPTTTLIVGESGTGKELVAESLHYQGCRASKPLIKVNCAALPDNLLESELFGHVRGAFTGAMKDRVGRLQLADGGTLFLDEIGDISAGMQLRLLRVLQEKEFELVGSSQTVKVDVRIVAATNQDLAEKVRLGEFREDLYYRLRIVPVHVPPLRKRHGDISLLVNHFVARFNCEFGKSIIGVDDQVLEQLKNYHWPGNVRELQHVLEHAFVRCRENQISIDCLPPELFHLTSAAAAGEREPLRIKAALKKTAYNKTKAAQLLGIDRKTLYRKLEKYQITLT